jgi:preprotein translocase subunit SecA
MLVSLHASDPYQTGASMDERIADDFATIIPFDDASKAQISKQLSQAREMDEKINFLKTISSDLYKKREEELGITLMRQIERFVVLSVIDALWVDHLDAIENLRQGIGLRGYGQKDPLVEYKNEAFKMFEQLISGVDDEIVHRIYKVQVQQAPMAHQHISEQAAGDTSISEELRTREVSEKNTKKTSAKIKLGRNDPCWCGSGKKYKKCHWPN